MKKKILLNLLILLNTLIMLALSKAEDIDEEKLNEHYEKNKKN